jgi:hypothetical protein
MDRNLTIKEIEKLAETQWEGCHGCDENDKYFWINGFVMGYINARTEDIDEKIDKARNKIADIILNRDTDDFFGGLKK